MQSVKVGKKGNTLKLFYHQLVAEKCNRCHSTGNNACFSLTKAVFETVTSIINTETSLILQVTHIFVTDFEFFGSSQPYKDTVYILLL